MNEFKVGDKVVLTAAFAGEMIDAMTVGHILETRVFEAPELLHVSWNNGRVYYVLKEQVTKLDQFNALELAVLGVKI